LCSYECCGSTSFLKHVIGCALAFIVLALVVPSQKAAAADTISIAAARDLAHQDQAANANCTIRGSVTLPPGAMATRPGDFYVQDDTGGILVRGEAVPALKLWERVEVSGHATWRDEPKNGAATEGSGPEIRIQATQIIPLGGGGRIEPKRVPLAEAVKGYHAGEFIVVRGQVVRLVVGDMNRKSGEANDRFILGPERGVWVYARRRRADPSWLKDLAVPGSEVEVRGISVPSNAHDFRIRLRASTDLAIIRPPSWFTVAHILWLLVGLACCALTALAWIISLQRTVRRRTAEIRQAEFQLRHAQKMEVVAQLASGIAHDFNNILMAINGYSELLLDGGLTQEQKHHVEQIFKAGQKAADLTRKLTAFSRGQATAPAILDLNRFIEDLRPKLEGVAGEYTQIDIHLGGDAMTITADPCQLEDVLIDLTANARDAMQNRGTVTISTDEVTITNKTDGIVPGQYVVLSVADTGHGMDAATVSRIFEPFFTTKDIGKGSGLGLSTVYGIVRQNHGNIKVDSAVGRGTTFKVYLPYKEGSPDNVSSQGLLFEGTQTDLQMQS
jgi:signal transduction histidine kinase